MKVIGDGYIDYWQSKSKSTTRRGMDSRFGMRVGQGCCWPLIQIGDEPPSSFGNAQEIPVDVQTLPYYVRRIVADHRASDPASDLLLVLSGRKSFQQALKSH